MNTDAHKIQLSANLSLVLAAVLLTSLLTLIFNFPSFVQAAELQNRSIKLSNYIASATSDHIFQFVVPTTSTLGSIVFLYCDNSPIINAACHAPAGLDVTGATITNQVTNVGFSVDNADTTANKLVITRPPQTGSVITSSYTISNIINPSASGTTVFVRIATYASNDASGPVNDNGSVAFVTASLLNVAAYVPPYLRFCVGLSVAADCSTSSGDSIELGIISANHANVGQSQFATGTNDPSGYVISVLGTTMTSGNNTITSTSSPSPSFPGNDQFGLNLRANTNPASGQDPGGAGSAVPTANYGIQNQFAFNDGDIVASSSLPTDYNRMTVSYVVNVNNAQPVGVYSTTITYVATVQF